jgi:hypothetical protein
MLNFFRRKKNKAAADLLFIEAFTTGLRSGIEMVRIAAARDHQITLTQLADIMQQTLNEFKDIK